MAYKNLIGIPCVDRKEVFKRLRDFAIDSAVAISSPVDGTYSVTVNGNKNDRYMAIVHGDVDLGENSQVLDLLCDN